MTFHGSQSECSGDFVQFVTRVAFEKCWINDDRWVAQFASTCLNGDALLWYCKLGEETQESWKRLRISLLQQYPPHSHTEDSAVLRQLSTPVLEDDIGASTPDSRTEINGVIEVVGKHATLLGYLRWDGRGVIAITPQKDDATVGSVLEHASTQAHQILLASQTETALPSYVGLALATKHSSSPNNPTVIPEPVEEIESDSKNYDPPMYYGVPTLSTKCVSYAKGYFGIDMLKELAAWTFCICGESRTAAPYLRKSDTAIPGLRAAAAVWKYAGKTEELRLSWLMDDEDECELAAYVHRDNLNSLHIHRLCDMAKMGRFVDEDRVKFVFSHVDRVSRQKERQTNGPDP
ncbi:hypothetical protein FS837_001790 [Tulasnella sp. UAMH 9824]|nr:hypothetical protein FS837_001790 [Tulasnella sp. UAMH 9824]